jgi:hypothetical protein
MIDVYYGSESRLVCMIACVHLLNMQVNTPLNKTEKRRLYDNILRTCLHIFY